MGWLLAFGLYALLVGISNLDFTAYKPSPIAQYWLDEGMKKPSGTVRIFAKVMTVLGVLCLITVALMWIF